MSITQEDLDKLREKLRHSRGCPHDSVPERCQLCQAAAKGRQLHGMGPATRNTGVLGW